MIDKLALISFPLLIPFAPYSKLKLLISFGVRYLLGCYDMYGWSDIIWLELGGCGYWLQYGGCGDNSFHLSGFRFPSAIPKSWIWHLYFSLVFWVHNLRIISWKKTTWLEVVQTHFGHSTGCPRSYRVIHLSISTYYVIAFWSGVDGVSCSKLLTLKIWMHDLYCLTLLNSNLQVLARYNYIYVEQNTKAFM